MVELLCVMLIIAILAAMYLGAISHAFVRVKKVLGGM
jgi:type II secretory pathway pseudopilin PulG